MDILDVVYAAGLFDGEGTVSLMRQTKTQMRSPTVSVSSTTYELVDFMKSKFGGHIVKLTRSKNMGHKQAWHWSATHNKAIALLTLIAPYLREPEKRRRAELILTQYKSVTNRGGKYTPELLEARQAFEEEFFLNSDKA